MSYVRAAGPALGTVCACAAGATSPGWLIIAAGVAGVGAAGWFGYKAYSSFFGDGDEDDPPGPPPGQNKPGPNSGGAIVGTPVNAAEPPMPLMSATLSGKRKALYQAAGGLATIVQPFSAKGEKYPSAARASQVWAVLDGVRALNPPYMLTDLRKSDPATDSVDFAIGRTIANYRMACEECGLTAGDRKSAPGVTAASVRLEHARRGWDCVIALIDQGEMDTDEAARFLEELGRADTRWKTVHACFLEAVGWHRQKQAWHKSTVLIIPDAV